jgi:hypothetical protein
MVSADRPLALFVNTKLGNMSNDPVNSPAHYTTGKVEVIDVIEDWVRPAPDPVVGGLQWQVIKYISRMWLKRDPYEDARKAQWYLNRLVNTLATEAYRDR